MTIEIGILLLLLLAAMTVFAFEWLSVDVVTLLLIASLVASGILLPQEAFSGFANEIIVILGSIFVLAGALEKTGVMNWLGGLIHRFSADSAGRILPSIMILSASLSAFLSNTSSTAVLIPAVSELSRRSKISPSRILMPLAYASILGGTCTLIGTSTNLAASGLLTKFGYPPLGFFELSGAGVIIVVVSIAYMSLIGFRFLPQKPFASLGEEYDVRKYLSEIVLPEGSSLAGVQLHDAPLSAAGLNVLAVKRGGIHLNPNAHRSLQVGDVLIVHGTSEALLKAKESADWDIEADEPPDVSGLNEAFKLMEGVVTPQSILVGKTVRETRFRQRYGASVLAVYRSGHVIPTAVRDLPIKSGDVLLLQGSEDQFRSLVPNLWLLGEVDHLPFAGRKGLKVLALLAGAIAVGSLGWLPLSICLMLAALGAVALKTVTMQEAYQLIEWRLLILIGGMTSFGVAMQETQAAEYLAGMIVDWILPFGLYFVLATFALLTMVLTQPMSNAAAALVVMPIALSTATTLGVNPRTFAVMVILSASLSFLTPLEPSCLLVYGPGRYRFVDFVKSGSVLTLLTLALLMLLVPWFWPF